MVYGAGDLRLDADEYDPAVLDGKRTEGLTPDKTNWALRLDSPPFRIYPTR